MDIKTIQRLMKNASPPNIAGKRAARSASGPMMTKVGITAIGNRGGGEGEKGRGDDENCKMQIANCKFAICILQFAFSVASPRSRPFSDSRLVFLASTSGPRPGGALGSGSGGAFFP